LVAYDAGNPDAGATLIEVMVALALIAVVSTFALQSHVMAMVTVQRHANREVAVQMAADLTDKARTYPGAELLASHQRLESAEATKEVGGVEFSREWSVDLCRQAQPGGVCSSALAAGPGIPELVRVTVTVRWVDRGSPAPVTVTALVDLDATDPVFTP
jgi:prepilin-type N-terminal cleavage/methylation domain-containing protein